MIDLLNSIFVNTPPNYQALVAIKSNVILENSKYYYILFKKEELINFNQEMEVIEYFPNHLFFAKDELNNLLAFNLNTFKVYHLSIDSDEEDAVLIADTFTEFLEKFEKEEIQI